MNKLDYSKIYSVSKLQLFDQCPKAYYFTYLDKIYSKMKAELKRDPENIWPFQTLGKAVHDAITLFLHLKPAQQQLKDLKNQLQKTWRSEARKSQKPPLGKWGGFVTVKEEREYYKQALRMLINFYQLFDQEKTVEYLPTQDLKNSIEDYQNLVKPLNEQDNISGKFDLIIKNEDGLEVVDFKTSKSQEKDNFQLRFYKLLAELNFEKPVKKASYYYLRQAEVKGFKMANLDSQKIKDQILAKISQVKQEKKFKVQPSKLCRYCLFRTFCPAQERIAKYIKQPTQQDLVDDLPF